MPSPAQPTIQTATGQSLILANGGTGTPGGIANGSGQLVPASQSVQLLQHVMTPTGEITQIPVPRRSIAHRQHQPVLQNVMRITRSFPNNENNEQIQLEAHC
uniref:Uncharacterized protein n=1 Tax=Anopheles melas TaxID=34690 RepID=A0A182TVM8_9DIPT